MTERSTHDYGAKGQITVDSVTCGECGYIWPLVTAKRQGSCFNCGRVFQFDDDSPSANAAPSLQGEAQWWECACGKRRHPQASRCVICDAYNPTEYAPALSTEADQQERNDMARQLLMRAQHGRDRMATAQLNGEPTSEITLLQRSIAFFTRASELVRRDGAFESEELRLLDLYEEALGNALRALQSLASPTHFTLNDADEATERRNYAERHRAILDQVQKALRERRPPAEQAGAE